LRMAGPMARSRVEPMTAAEHDAATRTLRELLREMGCPTAATFSPGALVQPGDPDLAHVQLAIHRDDGKPWLVFRTDAKLCAVPCTRAGVEWVMSPTFPGKVKRAEIAVQNAKAAIWQCADQATQALMVVTAAADEELVELTTGTPREIVYKVGERFAQILAALPVDAPLPSEVAPMLDEKRAPDDETLRRALAHKRELIKLESKRNELEAKRAEWAKEGEQREKRLHAWVWGPDGSPAEQRARMAAARSKLRDEKLRDADAPRSKAAK
jgi:hypothetical protein